MSKTIPNAPPSSDTASMHDDDRKTVKPETPLQAAGPYVGRPLDGSQYLDVVEEQEYADRRPSREEQEPRLARQTKQADGPAPGTPRG